MIGYVSHDLPYLRWFYQLLGTSALNFGMGLVNLWFAFDVDRGAWRFVGFTLAAVGFAAAAIVFRYSLIWLRKARLQKAGKATYKV